MFANKKNTLANLTKRSEQIFDVFTQTQKDCESLNSEIAVVVSSKEAEIKALQDEVSGLNAVKTKNDNLAKKIQTFLNS
jgi:wobble nucleotide-excising tRNase